MKTLIIGLGNPILSDDGVGIHVVRRLQTCLQTCLPSASDIDVLELSVGGITLMEHMVGYERVIIVDSLWTPANEIGEVRRFDAGDLTETLNTRSTHDADLPTALSIGRRLGAPLPEDQHIQIVAVTANDVLNFSETLSPAVAQAVPLACDAILQLLSHPILLDEVR